MATVEAMQNHVAPIVFNGGGQKEIVQHKKNGFRVNSLRGLRYYTKLLINSEDLRKKIAEEAYKRSHVFSYNVFKKKITDFFDKLEEDYLREKDWLKQE